MNLQVTEKSERDEAGLQASAGLAGAGGAGAERAVQLVAIDIDGTLLRSDKRLSRPVAQTVEAVCRSGVRVVLATARPPRSVREIYKHLRLDTYQINYNGALIYDPTRGRNVHHQPLDPVLAMRIIKLARKVHRETVVSVEILDRWFTDHVDETLPTETSRSFNPDFVGPLEAFMHVPLTKLMLLARPEALAEVRKAVEAKFAGKIVLAVSDAHLLQIIHPLADKGIALERIARHYKVRQRNVMAIGDAPNDVGMVTWAGVGVAVGNAWPTLRAAADVVVPGNDQDGVAVALRKYVLGQ